MNNSNFRVSSIDMDSIHSELEQCRERFVCDGTII